MNDYSLDIEYGLELLRGDSGSKPPIIDAQRIIRLMGLLERAAASGNKVAGIRLARAYRILDRARERRERVNELQRRYGI